MEKVLCKIGRGKIHYLLVFITFFSAFVDSAEMSYVSLLFLSLDTKGT